MSLFDVKLKQIGFQGALQGALGAASGGAIGFLGARVCHVLAPGSWIFYSSLHSAVLHMLMVVIPAFVNHQTQNRHKDHPGMKYGIPFVCSVYSLVISYALTHLCCERISWKAFALIPLTNTIIVIAENLYRNAPKKKKQQLMSDDTNTTTQL